MNKGARVGCVKEDLMRVRVDQEDRSDRLREEERALKECVALLKGRVETLVEKERAYMGMEEVVEGRFKGMYAREKESRAVTEEELDVRAKEVAGRAGCIKEITKNKYHFTITLESKHPLLLASWNTWNCALYNTYLLLHNMIHH